MPEQRSGRPGPARHFVRSLVGLLVMILLAFGVISFVFTEDRGVLVRNSLVVEDSSPTDFIWSPGSPPAGFRSELLQAPPLIRAVADSLRAERNGAFSFDMEAAEALVKRLHRTHGDERPIRGNPEDTYRLIVDEGWGYCADYTRTSMAILHALEVPVRHWGMGFGDLGAGHTFIEVYMEEFGEWVFLDPFFAFWVRSPETARPMSAIHFRDALLDGGSPNPVVEVIGEGIFSFPDEESILVYYRGAAEYFYMYWGNNVFQMHSHPVTSRLSSVSRSAGLLAGVALGVNPTIRPLPAATESHSAAVRELNRLRFTLLAAGLLFLLVGLWVLVEVVRGMVALRRPLQPRTRTI